MTNNKIYFIWTKGLRGPTPQIDYDLSNEYKQQTVLQKHELPLEYRDLNLNQLSMIYPYKGKEDEPKILA